MAEEECAYSVDAGVAFAGESEAADDELLLVNAFDFEPVAGAAGDVFGIGSFGDDAFGLEFAGFAEDFTAVGVEVLAEADVFAGVGEQAGEDGFAFEEWEIA